MAEVDLVINVWERTYPMVLSPGYFLSVEEQNQFRFARKILLINNVEDPARVQPLADELLSRGELDAYYWVNECLPQPSRLRGSL